MLFCHVYCHQKANYSKHTAISTTGLDMLKSVKFARESNYFRKELLAKECLK